MLLDLVRQEQAAVEVLDLAEQLAGLLRSFFFRLGEALKEEGLEEFRVIAVLAPRFRFGQLVAEVVLVAAVEKTGRLLLQEVDEHQAVQQDRGVPPPLPLVGDAANQLQEGDVLLLELAKELLGDLFDVQGRLQTLGHLDDADVPFGVEVGQVENHLAELAQEEVARLPLAIQVIAGVSSCRPAA